MGFVSRRLAYLAAFAGVAVAGAVTAFWTFRHYEPDPSKYPVRGVDVSHHQGRIDWARVKADGISFAYLKASEGRDHRDEAFADNWAGARTAGLAVGAYHFFTFCSAGRAQAANFLAAAPRAEDALPVAVDIEFGGNCGARPSPAVLARELAAFLSVVEAREGKRAVLYLTPEAWSAYRDVLPARGVWRRSILHAPPRDEPWVIWQYHNRGAVKGVDGPVDINVFAGSRRGFTRFSEGG